MQGIYTYIPEINNVPKEYNVAAILVATVYGAHIIRSIIIIIIIIIIELSLGGSSPFTNTDKTNNTKHGKYKYTY
jgi:hypothetical protein